ncbi:hypothetical protein MA16_Dca027530 [Dendrobium catenatum]|uniref:Uncharacterized protein n=1 Tax=Dendrobium catenatum TaxID=906689 RepID=A0A2I0W3M0_9ASPA|nr:hypothetical protein MA16_Dca027530 [Dendrobium catenatum]
MRSNDAKELEEDDEEEKLRERRRRRGCSRERTLQAAATKARTERKGRREQGLDLGLGCFGRDLLGLIWSSRPPEEQAAGGGVSGLAGVAGFDPGDRTELRARPWTGAALGLAGVRECQREQERERRWVSTIPERERAGSG